MANSAKSVRFQLSDGNSIPATGLGTWNSKNDEVYHAVKHAVKNGARLIDTACAYGNEKEIGKALREIFDNPQEYDNVRREDLFIVTKLWNTFHRPDLVRTAVQDSLANLGLDYLDGYLIHWPMAYKEDGPLFPKDENGKFIFSDVDYVDTWKAMVELKREGLLRSIGVSNFSSVQITRILNSGTSEKPAINQVELHPYWDNARLVDFCQKNGITVMAYSQFGSPANPLPREAHYAEPLKDPILQEIATRHGKAVSQVILRWLLQKKIVTIPKSVTPSRIEQNLDFFNFELSDAEIAQVDSVNRGKRMATLSWVSEHKHWPFHDEF